MLGLCWYQNGGILLVSCKGGFGCIGLLRVGVDVLWVVAACMHLVNIGGWVVVEASMCVCLW